MKSLLAVGVLIVLAIVAINRAAGPSVGPDTPVIVLSADPVKVLLPADPDETTIKGYVYTAMAHASDATSGTLASDLRDLADDGGFLDWVASTGESRFSSDEAAALAYPLYRATVTPERVTITTTTLELLPQHWAIGNSIAHEDGHAAINELLAAECGRSLVDELAASGKRGSALEAAIEQGLHELGNVAHERYHGMVNGASAPRYRQAARDAATGIIEAGC